jgi:hypothetical protein
MLGRPRGGSDNPSRTSELEWIDHVDDQQTDGGLSWRVPLTVLRGIE